MAAIADPPRLAGLLGLLLVACSAATAHAHMPLARGVAIAPDGERIALRLPGFGFVVGAGDVGYRYLCDAAAGVTRKGPPYEADLDFGFRSDGALWLGTRSGLRLLRVDGCPAPAFESELGETPIAALSVHDGGGQVYVATEESPPRLLRSDDGGRSFAWLADLPPGQVQGLRLAVDARGQVAAVYALHAASDSAGDAGLGATSLLAWSDGAGLQTHPLRTGDSLLHASVAPDGLWLLRAAVDGPGVVVAAGRSADGPFDGRGRARFFGGFAVAADGTLFLGDEGGGVQHAPAGTAAFAPYADTAVACLAHRDGLWGCTPGLPHRPALVRFHGESDSVRMEPVLSLSEVHALVACEARLAVDTVCEAAFREWRADVLMEVDEALDVPPSALAGTPDAGGPSVLDAGADWEEPSGGPAEAAAPIASGTGGCQVGHAAGAARWPGAVTMPFTLGFALLLLGLRPRASRLRAQAFWSSVHRMSRPRADSPLPPGVATATDEDAALIEQARGGDVDAFGALYDRHAPVLFGLCLRMGLSESEARDLLQDVFLEAWQAVRTYDGARASVRTWLIVRGRSRALDRLRRRRSQRAVHDELRRTRADQAASPPPPATERTLAVRAALASLDTDVRRALELTYYEGMTAAEVGARERVPEGTVRSRLARGMKALAGLLREPAAAVEPQAGPDDRSDA